MRYVKTIVLSFLFMAILLPNLAFALACGDRVVRNEILTADLYCTSGFYALEVLASGVTIDLNGHSISGDPALAGIVIQGKHGVTIKNGTIKDFWAGINTAEADDLNVEGVSFQEVGSGVIVSSGNRAQIRYNEFFSNWSDAISISNYVLGKTANQNYIDGNQFFDNRTAIRICGANADDNMIVGNFIMHTADFGIQLVRSERNLVTQNTIVDSNNTAVRLDDVNFSHVVGNAFEEGYIGVALLSGVTTPCLNSGLMMTHVNDVNYNSIVTFNNGVTLGTGMSATPEVFNNNVRFNKIYHGGNGIYFLNDAHNNDARTNTYTGTFTPITDFGIGNLY